MSTTSTPPVLPAPREPDAPYKVAMVCTGNICRSAMARVVFLDRLATAGLSEHVHVSSSGVSDEEYGNPIDPRARRVLREHGYGTGDDAAARAADTAITSHRAHRMSDTELADHDLVLAMTASHRRELVRRAERLGADATRVRMFRSYDPTAPQGARSQELDVPDPWYGTTEDFVDTLDVVERVCDALVPALAELVEARRA